MLKRLKDRKKHPYLSSAEINRKAEASYTTYSKSVLKKQAYGNVMPMWEDLAESQREAWRTVVLMLHQIKTVI